MSKRLTTLLLGLLLPGAGVLGCAHRPATFDIPPVLANREEITDAMETISNGTRAEIVLMIHVDTRGLVQDVRIERRSGDDMLDDAAVWVGERMRFQPAQYEGRNVPAWVRVPLKFEVKDPGNRPPQVRNPSGVAALMAEDYAELRGAVRLRVRVGLDGMATAVREEYGDGEELSRAALKLVERVRFWPGLEGFEPVDAWITFVFEFEGRDSRVYVDALEVQIED